MLLPRSVQGRWESVAAMMYGLDEEKKKEVIKSGVKSQLLPSKGWFVPSSFPISGSESSSGGNSGGSVVNKPVGALSLSLSDVVCDTLLRCEVSEVLTGMTHCIARMMRVDPYPTRPKLPNPFQSKSEIEVGVK